METTESNKEYSKRASNPMGRVNKPDDQQDIAATNSLSEAVEAMLDGLTPDDVKDK
ncbi:hypothetical protein [Gorillibacterium sp. sgz5001074]|uniref:hypothetical protein n=1 Tax=Gorillibacterium sp. sgz5001074 TaxID=3446695 RepID=UPI003F666044